MGTGRNRAVLVASFDPAKNQFSPGAQNLQSAYFAVSCEIVDDVFHHFFLFAFTEI